MAGDGVECLAVVSSWWGTVVKPPTISFHQLTLAYDKQPVIQNLELKLPQGVLLAVIGANGTGKSTLLKAVMGELKPVSGSIHLQGLTRRDIAYLPQQTALEPDFPINVQDCVAMGLWRQLGAFGKISALQKDQINDALATVGLSQLAQRPLSRLSVGQRQRVLFARLLLQDAPVILLDEPFNAVDEKTIQDLMQLVEQWHRQGCSVLAVLHDWQLGRRYFPETLWLTEGQARYGASTTLIPQALERWAA